MTDMAVTSLEAYKVIKSELNTRQEQVLKVLTEPMTNKEIVKAAGMTDACQGTGRIAELRKLRLITEAGMRKCRITGFLAQTWRKTTAEERMRPAESQPSFFDLGSGS